MHCIRPEPAGVARMTIAFLAMAILLVQPCNASKIILTIRAGHQMDGTQKVPIRANLPAHIRTNDIIDLAGLDLGYDFKSDVYYVYKDVELASNDPKVFDVVMNDVWVVSKNDTDELRKHSADLAGKLKGLKDYATAEELRRAIDSGLQQIDSSQATSALSAGVPTVDHLKAYERDLKALARVKRDVRRLENIVLAAGIDPGGLVDDEKDVHPTKRDVELPATLRTAIFRITVHNDSPTYTRTVSIKRMMPPEIKVNDILDSGGLEVGIIDPTNKTAYVYKTNVVVAANSNVVYEVKINDKWNVNGPRIQPLKAAASNLLVRISSKDKFPTIVKRLTELIAELDGVAVEQGPKELNDQYVEFFRRQADRLDAIQLKLERVEATLQPISSGSKLGPKVKAPSAKTTWLIIYIILGFMALMSLLFFLSWFGKSKAEKMEDLPPPTEGR
jgi:hypothetical protein